MSPSLFNTIPPFIFLCNVVSSKFLFKPGCISYDDCSLSFFPMLTESLHLFVIFIQFPFYSVISILIYVNLFQIFQLLDLITKERYLSIPLSGLHFCMYIGNWLFYRISIYPLFSPTLLSLSLSCFLAFSI